MVEVKMIPSELTMPEEERFQAKTIVLETGAETLEADGIKLLADWLRDAGLKVKPTLEKELFCVKIQKPEQEEDAAPADHTRVDVSYKGASATMMLPGLGEIVKALGRLGKREEDQTDG